MKARILCVIFTFTLFLTTVTFNMLNAYGTEYLVGQSIFAKDQEKASLGLNFLGLDITCFDLRGNSLGSYSHTEQFNEGLFSLSLSDGILCFDTSGKIIAHCEYDGVYEFSDGMAKVYKYLPPSEPFVLGRVMGPPGSIEGFIDKEGNEVIPMGKFHNVSDKFHEGFAVIGGHQDLKGYINKLGEIVIDEIYKDATDFSEGLAAVQSAETELWGYIDKEGKLVIPMVYKDADPFREGVAYVVMNNLAGYINKDGNVAIDFKFKPKTNVFMDNSFYGGLAVAQDSSGKYGYIDKNGDFVIQAKYKDVSPFIEDATFVTLENQNYPNGYGSSVLINRSGERLTPLWHYKTYYGEHMREGLIKALSPNGTYELMLNKYGAEVIPSSLGIEYISSFNEGYAIIKAHNKGSVAVGLVKKPENIEEFKKSKLIKVFLNNEILEFNDIDPVIENSRTLVPMRSIFEALGADIIWDDINKTVIGTKDGTTISLKIGESKAYINNEPVELDVPAKIENSRTMIPLRFVAESFNADVSWDNELRVVQINTK